MRRAILISSNNRIDRDGEIVSKRALQEYVTSAYRDGVYVGNNDLLMWHAGDPIGKVKEADVIHGFLVELVEELPDAPVNIGTPDNPFMTTIKACWDAIEKNQDKLGVSQGFQYRDDDLQDGVFRRIVKYESSILPIEIASNPYTLVKLID
jgi:hypothetical protein